MKTIIFLIYFLIGALPLISFGQTDAVLYPNLTLQSTDASVGMTAPIKKPRRVTDSMEELKAPLAELQQSCGFLDDEEMKFQSFDLPRVTHPNRFSSEFEVALDRRYNVYSINFKGAFYFNVSLGSLTINFNKGFVAIGDPALRRTTSRQFSMVPMNKESISSYFNDFASVIYFSARGISMENESGEMKVDNDNSSSLKKLSCIIDAMRVAEMGLYPGRKPHPNLIRENYTKTNPPLARSCDKVKAGEKIKLDDRTIQIYPKTGLIISHGSKAKHKDFSIDANLCSIRGRGRIFVPMFLLSHDEEYTYTISCGSDGFLNDSGETVDAMVELRLNEIYKDNTDPKSKSHQAITCIRDSLESMLRKFRDGEYDRKSMNVEDVIPERSFMY